MNTPDKYYRRVAERLGTGRGLPSDASPAQWTNHVHTQLVQLVTARANFARLTAWSKAFAENPKDRHLRHGEYLVDLAVCREEHDCDPCSFHSKYEGILLAAETEWHHKRSAIWTDLVKLTDIRATYRVFVGGLKRELHPSFDQEAATISEQIRGYCKRHQHFQESDTMLVFFWDYDSPEHTAYHAWVFNGAGEIGTL